MILFVLVSLCMKGVCVCVTPHNIIEHLYDYKLGIIDIALILPDNLSKDDDLSVLCSDV